MSDRPGYEMVVERGKVREFATATKSTHEAYLDDPQPVSPPTFLVTSGFWAPRMRPEQLAAMRQARGGGGGGGGGGRGGGGGGGGGGGMARILDGGKEYIFHGPPPRAGQRLRVVPGQTEQYEREGSRGGKMHFTVSTTEFRDAETDQLLVEQKATMIRTERAPTRRDESAKEGS